MNLPAFLRAHWKLIATAGVILALSLYAWRLDALRAGYRAERDQVRTEYAAFRKAITDRTAAALAKEKEQARAADISHEKQLADARSATDRFIDANRVQPARSCHSPAPTAPGAGLPQEVPAGPLVAVSDGDVRACTDAVIYAVEAHKWAISLDPN